MQKRGTFSAGQAPPWQLPGRVPEQWHWRQLAAARARELVASAVTCTFVLACVLATSLTRSLTITFTAPQSSFDKRDVATYSTSL
ncbi:hypothetical protein J1614_004138 [Plenodomus biglobosus]|nr:hypothetical protein J1614_004138 [Plenodomus biglobosus]